MKPEGENKPDYCSNLSLPVVFVLLFFLKRTNQPGMFTKKEFDQLASAVDSFSLMTYDYSTPQR